MPLLLRLSGHNKKTGNTSLALTTRRVLPAYHLRRRTGSSEAATACRAERGPHCHRNPRRLSRYFFFGAFFLAFFLAAMMSSFGLGLRDLQGSQGPKPPDATARCHDFAGSKIGRAEKREKKKKTVLDCLLMDSGLGHGPGFTGGYNIARGAGRTGPGSRTPLQVGTIMLATGCRASQSIH